MLNKLSSTLVKHSLKAKSELLTFTRSGGVTLFDEFDECGINGLIQNIATLKYAKMMEIGSGILKMYAGPPV